MHLEAKNIHHEEKISFEKQVNDSQNKISSLSEDVSKLKADIATAEKVRNVFYRRMSRSRYTLFINSLIKKINNFRVYLERAHPAFLTTLVVLVTYISI